MPALPLSTRLKAVIVQHSPVFLNLDESLIRACDLIEEAAAAGAQLIAFPETWLPGYPVWLDHSPHAARWDHPPAKALFGLLFENSLEVPGPGVSQLQQAVDRTGSFVVMGCHERAGGTLYNTILFLAPGGVRPRIHRKLVPTYSERLVWGRGDGSTLDPMHTPFGPIGALVCWEHWMPLARAAMHAQGESVHVAQWPTVRDIHQVASRHYAFEGGCFVLAAGCYLSRADMMAGYHSLGKPSVAGELLESMTEPRDQPILRGGSAIIAPDGTYLTEPAFDRPALIQAELDLSLIHEARLVLDVDGHYSRPDIFQLTVNRRPQRNVVFEDNPQENE